MFIIDGIVIYSMMLMDVEERTYEFAMLRTLGFQNNSLVVLLLVQTIFFSLPATVIGFMLLQLFTALAQIVLFTHVNISLQVPVHLSTVVLGILTGIGIPLFSNIHPIKSALSSKLRDALDRSRQNVDDIQVQLLRTENAGMSLPQILLGLALVSTSFLTLILIPMSALEQQVPLTYERMGYLLIGVIIGVAFVS